MVGNPSRLCQARDTPRLPLLQAGGAAGAKKAALLDISIDQGIRPKGQDLISMCEHASDENLQTAGGEKVISPTGPSSDEASSWGLHGTSV